MPVRAVIVVLALAAAGWLAGNIRANDLSASASDDLARAGGPGKTAQRREATEKFARARRFSDDTVRYYAEAAGFAVIGRDRESARLASDIVRREPDNFEGWSLLFAVVRQSDPALAKRARAKLIELDPQVRDQLPR